MPVYQEDWESFKRLQKVVPSLPYDTPILSLTLPYCSSLCSKESKPSNIYIFDF